MFSAARRQRQAEAAERAQAYSAWLLEEESLAEWRQHAKEVPVTQLLDDGNTLTVFRWQPRQIVAEKVLAAQQRLAFAQGALNERLGADTSPLWDFGWDGCHEMFEKNAKLIREVFLTFEWDITVLADPELRMEVTCYGRSAQLRRASGTDAPPHETKVEEERHCTVM